MTHSRRPVLIFLALAFGFSSIFYALIIWSRKLGAGGGLLVTGIMWCPALAAVLACRILGRDLGTLGWRWPQRKYILAGYFIPLAYAAVAYGGVWALRLGGYNAEFAQQVAQSFGLKGLPAWGALTLYLVLASSVGIVRSCASALGEEIGWRGFLVPELARMTSFTKTALISGFIWAAWHAPILLFADYNSGTPAWYALTCFTIMVVSISFLFAWLRLKSGSLWPAMLLHGSHNLFVQAIFDNLMRDTGKTAYVTTEFGAALAMVSVVVAILVWRRRGQVEQPQLAAVAEAVG